MSGIQSSIKIICKKYIDKQINNINNVLITYDVITLYIQWLPYAHFNCFQNWVTISGTEYGFS